MLSLRNRARYKAIFAVTLCAAAAPCAAAETADTSQLAAHLKTLRGRKALTADEYSGLQAEYMDWIDVRVKAGIPIEAMNAELRAAALFFHWADSADEIVDEYSKSRAGYLEPISTRALRGAAELLAIKAAIYKGIGCDLDMTVAVYEKDPLKRLLLLRAAGADSTSSYHLSGLDAAKRGAAGDWLVASSWTISNCASAWNGKRVRIDVANRAGVKNLVAKDLYAQDRDRGEDVAVWVQRDLVTFWYEGGIRDEDLVSAPAIMRYRVTGDVAVREGPVALTRAGFLQEWLKMDDAEAARWSESEAAGKHAAASAAFAHETFSWQRISRCEGSPQAWEIEVHPNNAKTQYVFRITGSHAGELRMASVGERPSESCVPVDFQKNRTGLGGELPW